VQGLHYAAEADDYPHQNQARERGIWILTIRHIVKPKRLLGETLEFRRVAEDIQRPVAATAVHGFGPFFAERSNILWAVHDSVQHENDIHTRWPEQSKVVEEELLEDNIDDFVFVVLAVCSTSCAVFECRFNQNVE
jgi:hypothetical protein